ncbi:sensor histidine kinase [Streptosporangium sp. 'caverna']|uniref:sensor histidine kinase n=1 Tax=Streptosporangium sp. 'caverna' TaxID=2202249 RepID=UPI0013A6DCDC|nr:histidine kinase [Streptosporangium sp. 'caverna']
MELKPQVVRALVAVALLALLGARLGQLVHPNAGSLPHRVIAISLVVALIAVHSLLVLRERPRPGLLVAVEAVLTFGPFLVVGGTWGPIAGVLGSAVLLTLAAPASWLLFALVMVADTGISCLYLQDAAVIVARTVTDLNVGLSLFALVVLADRVSLASAQRRQLAALAVARDRLDTVDRLGETIGTDLSAIVGSVRSLGAAMTASPEATGTSQVRRPDEIWTGLTEVVRRARRSLAAAREIADTHRLTLPASGPAESAPVPVMFRFAWWTLLLIVVDYTAITLVNLVEYRSPDTVGWAVAVAVLIVSGGLQLYHGAPRRDSSSPRAWPWTLSAHALVLATGVTLYGLALIPPGFLVVGAAMVRMRPRRSLAVGGLSLLGLVLIPDPDYITSRLYWLSGVVMGAALVYSLCRLPEVTRHLNETRDRLARMAVRQARLRVARDVHDLLGSGLSAIVLKGELAARLLESAPDRAHREVRELLPIAQRTLGEVRAITGPPTRLIFTDELAAARSLLEAAGVRLSAEVAAPLLPADADTLLATVLREAATNVVRHSRAELARVEIAQQDGMVTLRVSNDGVEQRPESSSRRGTGLDNLAARAVEAGGRLMAGLEGDLFVLTAEVPL